MKPVVERTENFVQDAAAFILETARLALAERGEFRIALSGGRTPRPVYEEIARAGRDLPWDRIFITFGDERCVPPDDEQSNYRMAQESLFLPAAVPEQSVARLRGELDPQTAAREYEDHLNDVAAHSGEMIYRHDLILLGLGDDGHTASLFPGTAALEETVHRVAANFIPDLDAWRLTFTLPLITQARRVCFLVDGNKPQELIENVLQPDAEYPASRVHNSVDDVKWIIAERAAV